jgi:hypothetical protein
MKVALVNRENYPVIGSDFFQDKKVIITGLVRDSKDTLYDSILFLYSQVLPHFGDYLILVYENDSKDSTREILLEQSSKDPRFRVMGCGEVNAEKCELGLKKTTFKVNNTSATRINKMAILRNHCIDEIQKQEYDDYPFVIVYDFDLNGNLTTNGVTSTGKHFETDPEIDGICALTLAAHGTYYDPYAHEEYGDKWKFARKPLWYWTDSKKAISGLERVNSCFNGFMVYRRESFIQSRYGTYRRSPTDQEGVVCEHVFFNNKLSKIYTNHDMLFIL